MKPKTETIPQAILTRQGRKAIPGGAPYIRAEAITDQDVRNLGLRSFRKRARRFGAKAAASAGLVFVGTGVGVAGVEQIDQHVVRPLARSVVDQKAQENVNYIQDLSEQAHATGHEPAPLVGQPEATAAAEQPAAQGGQPPLGP